MTRRWAVLGAGLWLSTAWAATPARFGPFGNAAHPVTRDAAGTVGSGAGPRRESAAASALFLRLAYDFYRTVVSSTNGAVCSHRPTCSRYGLIAVQRHGAVGMLMTIDRLWRGPESSAVRLLPIELAGGEMHYLDPLEETTFWFPSSP